MFYILSEFYYLIKSPTNQHAFLKLISDKSLNREARQVRKESLNIALLAFLAVNLFPKSEAASDFGKTIASLEIPHEICSSIHPPFVGK